MKWNEWPIQGHPAGEFWSYPGPSHSKPLVFPPYAIEVGRSPWKGKQPENEVLKVYDLGEGKEYLHNIECFLHIVPQHHSALWFSHLRGNYSLPLKNKTLQLAAGLLDFMLLLTGDYKSLHL